jgi:hypothetical protein
MTGDTVGDAVRRVEGSPGNTPAADRSPLSELPAIHAEAEAGRVHGKVVVVPSAR